MQTIAAHAGSTGARGHFHQKLYWQSRHLKVLRLGCALSAIGVKIALAAVIVLATGCAAIDPQHVLTRSWGNDVPVDGAALDATARERAYEFVWQRIDQGYVDPQFNGVNWQRVGQTHRAGVLSAANDDVFWSRLDTMVAELGDAHTRVLSPQQYVFHQTKQNNTLGLALAEIDGTIIVSAAAPASPGTQAGITAGNRLLSIDGTPALDWWQLQKSVARKNSTDRARLKTVKRVFNAGDPKAPSDTLRLLVERNDGSTQEATLSRTVLPRKETLTSVLRSDGVGYLRLTGFDPKLSSEIAPAFARVSTASGLVIDLRGNGGGSLSLSLALMDQLVAGPVPLGKRVTRSGKPPTFLMGLVTAGTLDLKLKGVKKPFLGPVAVLVDGDSASASEFLSGALQAIGRAQIVGETTCGCLLGYMGYANVPGGGALAYSEMDFALLKGTRIEGAGVQPEHVVPLSRQDLQQGRDRALETAIAVLTAAVPGASVGQ